MALCFVIAGSSGDVPCLRSVCGTVTIHIGECVSYVSGGSHICAVLVGVDTGSCDVVQWEFANAFIVEEDGKPVLHTCSKERRPSPYEVLQIYDEDTKIHIATSQVMQKAAVLGEQEWARLCSSLKSDVPLHTYFSRYMRVSQGTGQGLRKAIVSKHPMQAPTDFWSRWQLTFDGGEPKVVTRQRKVCETPGSKPMDFDEDEQYLDRVNWSHRLSAKDIPGNPRHKMYIRLLRLCQGGRPVSVRVTGSMGIGKTTVAGALMTDLRKAGKAVFEVNSNLAGISGKLDHHLCEHSIDVLIVEEYDTLGKQLLSKLSTLIKALRESNPYMVVVYIGNARDQATHDPRTQHIAFATLHPASMIDAVQMKTAGLDEDMAQIEDTVCRCTEAHDMRQVLFSMTASRRALEEVDRPCKRQRAQISSIATFISQ